jgi:hypothetical protein
MRRLSRAASPPASCEIYSVGRKNHLRWRWRHTGADGVVIDCVQDYERLYECVRAAHAQGYEPRAWWTGCALVSEN